jgi:hypothetical protein
MNNEVEILIDKTQIFLNTIEKKAPKRESLEWYLINNLKDFLISIKQAQSKQALNTATRILSRFCLESMDWDTELFKTCSEITELGLKISKNI